MWCTAERGVCSFFILWKFCNGLKQLCLFLLQSEDWWGRERTLILSFYFTKFQGRLLFNVYSLEVYKKAVSILIQLQIGEWNTKQILVQCRIALRFYEHIRDRQKRQLQCIYTARHGRFLTMNCTLSNPLASKWFSYWGSPIFSNHCPTVWTGHRGPVGGWRGRRLSNE